MASSTFGNMSSRTYDDAASATGAQTTGWVGWGVFAATMMIIGGSLNAFYGLIAAVNDDWTVWTNRGSVYLDLSQWGWVHMVVGGLVVIAGLGVLTGNILARTVGVLIAGISMLTNFFFMPAYPLWAITVIVIDALVIWALTAHGRELRER